MWEQLKRIIKPNGAIVLFGSEPFASALRLSNIKQYKYDWYWHKDRASNFLNARKQPMRNIETISVFNVKQYKPVMERWGSPSHSIGKAKGALNKGSTQGKRVNVSGNESNNEKYPRTLIYFTVPHPPIHPTQKPVALLEYLIKTYTNEGETVLDFTAGSGTTGIAAINTNRNAILIEREPDYCEIIKRRIAEAEPPKNNVFTGNNDNKWLVRPAK